MYVCTCAYNLYGTYYMYVCTHLCTCVCIYVCMYVLQLIAALESHVTLLRGTLKKKAKTKKKHLSMDLSLMKPRAASMAIEVSIALRYCISLGNC